MSRRIRHLTAASLPVVCLLTVFLFGLTACTPSPAPPSPALAANDPSPVQPTENAAGSTVTPASTPDVSPAAATSSPGHDTPTPSTAMSAKPTGPSATPSTKPSPGVSFAPSAPQISSNPSSPPPSARPSTAPTTAAEGIVVSIATPDGVWPDIALTETDDIKTVYDALAAACRLLDVNLTTRGGGTMLYIESIGSYRERDLGPLSGWMYWVNGQKATLGVGAFQASPGDRISFVFVEDFTKY